MSESIDISFLLESKGYHAYQHEDFLKIYLHGDFKCTLHRYNSFDVWRGHCGIPVTKESLFKIVEPARYRFE